MKNDPLPLDPLRPRGPSGETQEVNVAAKGDRRPGDRIRPNLVTATAQGAAMPWIDEVAASVLTRL